jgi:hypothetical protein
MLAPHLRPAIKAWPVMSAIVRRELIHWGVCPECGSDAPQGISVGADETKNLPMNCYECGWHEAPQWVIDAVKGV